MDGVRAKGHDAHSRPFCNEVGLMHFFRNFVMSITLIIMCIIEARRLQNDRFEQLGYVCMCLITYVFSGLAHYFIAASGSVME